MNKKTLVIGDIHLSNWYPGYLDAQIKCLEDLREKERPKLTIFLGDVFHNRRPSAPVLLAFKNLLEHYEKYGSQVIVIMGNHDAHSKADDGMTALKLLKCRNTHIITSPSNIGKNTYIPHYENEEHIKQALRKVPAGNRVFGHFSYAGLINARNNYDFTIDISEFRNPTYLGHVHRFTRNKPVTVVGTPYTTQFTENGKRNYYLVLEGEDERLEEVVGGPRHLIFEPDQIPEYIDFINDPDYYTLLRLNLDLTKEANQQQIEEKFKQELNVAYVESRFKPVIPKDKIVSNFKPDRELFTVNDAIFEDYIENSNTSLSKEDLWLGLEMLKDDENQS